MTSRKRLNWKNLLLLFLITLILAIGPAPTMIFGSGEDTPNDKRLNVTVASSTTKMYVSPPSIVDPDLTPGEIFSIDVNIADVKDLFGWSLYLSWDIPLLDVLFALEGPFLKRGGSTSMTQKIYNDEGYIYIINSLMGMVPGVDGSGTLCTIRFKVEGTGSCTLDLYDTVLGDSSVPPNPIDHTTEDGYFSNVVAAPDFSITASPTSLTIQQDSSDTSTITVTSLNGFSAPVDLAVTSAPITGVTTTLDPISVTPPADGSVDSTLTVSVDITATPGAYTLTVTGTSGALEHPVDISLEITELPPPPDFSITALPTSLTIVQGDSDTSTITVTSLNGFSEQVDLSVSGVPSGVTATLDPTSVTPPADDSITSTLTVSVDITATPDTYTLTVTGTSGTLTHSVNIELTVTPAPDFSISASPTSLIIQQGSSDTSTITITSLNAFSATVDLTVSGVPPNVIATLDPTEVTPPPDGSDTSTLTVQVDVTATTGTYTLTVTGISGTLKHSVDISLEITELPPPPDFSLSTSPDSLTIQQGSSDTSTITVTSLNGFSDLVVLTVSGQPSGVTPTLDPDQVTPPADGQETSTLTVVVDVTASVGTYTLTVTGTSGTIAHSVDIGLEITEVPPPPDFLMSADPDSLIIQQGSSDTSTITVTSLHGFTGTVDLTVSGEPSGVTATLDPTSVTPPADGFDTSTLTVSVDATAALGIYTLTVTGTSGALEHSVDITLEITELPPPPDFSISASPTSLTIQQGSSDTSTITITSLNGFNQPVDLAVSGEPSGVTATLDPSEVTPPADDSATSILTVSVDTTATPGTYTLTVTGTSGTLVHTVDITLEISGIPPPTRVYVDPSMITAEVGDYFTVNINVADVTGLFAWEFFLGWDAELLYTDETMVTEGDFLNQGMYPTTFVKSVYGYYMQVSCVLQIPVAVDGSGTLAQIQFEVRGTGQCSLDLYDTALRDMNGAPISHTSDDGVFYTTYPRAEFTYSPSPTTPPDFRNPVVDEIVTFDASSSYDPDGEIVSYFWDLGDGTTDTGMVVTHAYSEAGTYIVTLTVTDDNDLTDTATESVTVELHDIAIIDITVSPTTVRIGETVSIDVTVENQGTATETFNVTAYYDNTVIATVEDVDLAAGGTVTLNFVWDTTGVAEGVYTIKAEASEVPNETDIEDNIYVYGTITVTLPVGWIEGTVTDADTGLPLEGATVSANGYSDVTDPSGFYSIEIPAGTYDVTAEMVGYEPQTVTDVSIAADQTMVLDFALVPIGVDTTPPTITIYEPVSQDYLHSEAITIDFDVTDLQSGVASVTATLDGTPVTDGQVIELFTLNLGEHTFTVTAVDNAGNTATETVSFNVIATIDSLIGLVDKFYELGFIDEQDVQMGLKDKLIAAKAKIEEGKIRTAMNILKAFLHQLRAQSGKHITVEAAEILKADAEYLLNHL